MNLHAFHDSKSNCHAHASTTGGEMDREKEIERERERERAPSLCPLRRSLALPHPLTPSPDAPLKNPQGATQRESEGERDRLVRTHTSTLYSFFIIHHVKPYASSVKADWLLCTTPLAATSNSTLPLSTPSTVPTNMSSSSSEFFTQITISFRVGGSYNRCMAWGVGSLCAMSSPQSSRFSSSSCSVPSSPSSSSPSSSISPLSSPPTRVLIPAGPASPSSLAFFFSGCFSVSQLNIVEPVDHLTSSLSCLTTKPHPSGSRIESVNSAPVKPASYWRNVYTHRSACS
mmetsp:Transcript_12745/g.38160  ORF Transcript_12745/g.38160 Transcript_12745/m.38160 type:complete len:287 (-) Transcript_12745:39-899(-)